MLRALFAALVVCSVCGCSSSDTSSNAATGGGTGNSACPDVSGTWTVTAHCDPSLIGQKLVVTEASCALSFAAPFNGFSGSVSTAGKIALSGAQSCTGDATASAISMTCTPGTCTVTLAR